MQIHIMCALENEEKEGICRKMTERMQHTCVNPLDIGVARTYSFSIQITQNVNNVRKSWGHCVRIGCMLDGFCNHSSGDCERKGDLWWP